MKQFVVLCAIATFLLLLTRNPVNCERILVIELTPLHSHQVVFQSLSRALSKRGHEVVFVTSKPTKDPSFTNYTEIDMSITYTAVEAVHAKILKYNTFTQYEIDGILYHLCYEFSRYFYSHRKIKEIYAPGSNEKFDVVIAEGLIGLGVFALAHILNAPLIAVSSTDIHTYHNYLLGAPLLPSHPSNWEFYCHRGASLTFWDRVQNYVNALFAVSRWYHYQTGIHEQLVRSFVGEDIPPLYDIAKNMSLLLINYDPIIGYARPLPPNVVPFNGLHIEEQLPPLPKELGDFLGNATNGFIYMSLGCNMNSSALEPPMIRAIYNAFSRLPYKVLWKYEKDDIPKKSGNILTSTWIPQQAVLAHPNIKLFILQGGTQSTDETVHYGVPIVGMPIMFEQTYRIRKLASLGVGRMLDYTKINEEIFYETVYDVINNKSYKEKMTEVSELVKNDLYSRKEHVVWWIEYVMRHKGVPHLRFNGADDPWYQRFDMDIVAFLSVISFTVAVICLVALARVLQWFYKLRNNFTTVEGKRKIQ